MAFLSKVGGILRQPQTVGKQVVSHFSPSGPSIFHALRWMSSSKVYIGGLSYGTDETTLRDTFAQYGEVVDARIIVDRESGRSKGFGFVAYTSSEQASCAIQALDGQEIQGRSVKVSYARERQRPSGIGGGGYSGGGYGGGGFGGGGYGGGGYGGFRGGGYGGFGGGGYGGSGYRGAGGGHDGYNSGGGSYGGGYNDGGFGGGGDNLSVSGGNVAGGSCFAGSGFEEDSGSGFNGARHQFEASAAAEPLDRDQRDEDELRDCAGRA